MFQYIENMSCVHSVIMSPVEIVIVDFILNVLLFVTIIMEEKS